MTDEVQRSTLEDRRLALEERKWASESALRKLELDIKARESGWTARLVSPLTATLFAGILTIAGSVAATLLQGANTLQLETEKFKATEKLENAKFVSSKNLETLKQQHELILKMASVGDVEQAKTNVRFLAETGLITDKNLADKILASKEIPVLPRPSAVPSSSAPQSPPIPLTTEEMSRRISADAINMIIRFETAGGRENYEARLSHPMWFEGPSGVTIGMGYDLGYTTEDQFRKDWSSTLPAAVIDRLASTAGIKGAPARDLAAKLSDISVRWEDALAVFGGTVVPRWVGMLDRALPNAKELPPDSFGALVSLIYNRGASFKSQGDRFKEMRAIAELADSRNFALIPEQIRGMKRLWPEMKGLQERRELEAKLFEKGLNPTDDARIVGVDVAPKASPSP
jgi:hypothetical protein